jgi:adenylosuccinate lyase
MKVWDEGKEFQPLVKADPDIAKQLTAEEIDRVFSLDHYLRNVDVVFGRVFK